MKCRELARKVLSVCSLSGVGMGALLTAGCASIVGGTSQPVSVSMRSANGQEILGAQCKLQNSKGTWYTNTPGTLTIHRAYGDLLIACNKDGEAIGEGRSISSVRGWMFGNIAFGGIIGVGVDLGTGAGFGYPTTITIGSRRPFPDVPDTSTPASIARIPATVGTELPSVQRQVSSGIETMVAAHADLDRMCLTSGPTPSVQVLENSQHGALEIKQGEFVAPGAQASDACASGKVYGTQIYYQPQAGFHGVDHIRYAVVVETGHFTRMVDIEVK